MRQTSLISYFHLKQQGVLGKGQKEVLSALQHLWSATDNEIARFLGYADPNKVRPRRNELVKQGLVFGYGKRQCSITNKKCIEWRLL